jgi:hypothetical protein
MINKHSELYKGDIVIFNSKSGTASFTTIKNKGTYFTPSKIETRLDGIVIPIKKHEIFMYIGNELLCDSSKNRAIRLSFTRAKTNQNCFLSEFYMHKYFVKPEDQTKFLEEYRWKLK